MKIIDKTPFQKESGEIDLVGRIQGTLKYGFTWYAELQAQQAAIGQLQRLFEKGVVLIRNLTLPGTEIIVPIILVGPQGINVIYVTNTRGFYEAKGDEWNTVSGGRSLPANVNLISRVKLLGRAVQVYLQRQNLEALAAVEPVLIGTDPGFHVETTRPAVRVVMSDAIKQFGAALLQARPVLKPQQVYDLADRIVTPRPKEEAPAPDQEAPERARAIFDAAQDTDSGEFNPSDLSFAFDDGQDASAVPAELRESAPAQPLPRPQAKKRIAGMTSGQLVFLILAGLFELCILGVAAYLIFFSQP
jgi:hypothetical protein